MILVSVVVPIYNVEKYLDECLKSIQKQTLHDIEIICINDGSTDNSANIIDEFIKKDSRFRCISKPNSGYGDTMNKGFEAAKGEYIGIVESDDFIDKNMFKTLYEFAKNNNCDIVKSNYIEFSKNKKRIIKTATSPTYYNKILNSDTPEIFHFRMNTWTGIYRKTFIEENNIKHNTTPGASYQDNGFWFQTLSLADRIMFVDKEFYHYRQDNPNSSINSRGKIYCMCDEYKYIEDFLNNHPDKKDQLMEVFLTKKYFNYMYTYNRIKEEFKIDFLQRFAKEFSDHCSKYGYLKISDENIKKIIYRIIENPLIFYYEDTIWQLQHNIMKKQLKKYDPEYKNNFLRKLVKKCVTYLS